MKNHTDNRIVTGTPRSHTHRRSSRCCPTVGGKLQRILPEDRFTVVVHHGKTLLTNVVDFLNAQTQMGKTGIVVTSLGLMTRMGAIHVATWDRLVIDEAHYARNPKTRLFRKCKNLKATTKWMLAQHPSRTRRKI